MGKLFKRMSGNFPAGSGKDGSSNKIFEGSTQHTGIRIGDQAAAATAPPAQRLRSKKLGGARTPLSP